MSPTQTHGFSLAFGLFTAHFEWSCLMVKLKSMTSTDKSDTFQTLFNKSNYYIIWIWIILLINLLSVQRTVWRQQVVAITPRFHIQICFQRGRHQVRVQFLPKFTTFGKRQKWRSSRWFDGCQIGKRRCIDWLWIISVEKIWVFGSVSRTLS